jgi:hypothetical protein
MAVLSGQKTVTTAGAAVELGSAPVYGSLIVKALDTNTGKIYVGNNGSATVSSSTGLVLLSSEVVVFEYAGSLGDLFIDSSVNGEGVSWLVLDV